MVGTRRPLRLYKNPKVSSLDPEIFEWNPKEPGGSSLDFIHRTRKRRGNCWGQKLLSQNQRLNHIISRKPSRHILGRSYQTKVSKKDEPQTSPVRRTAELDQPRIQLGCSPSWTQDGFISAVRRAGPKTDSAWPFVELDKPCLTNGRAGSTETLLRLVLVTPLLKLHRTHSCFVSIEGIVGTLRFKNHGNSSFLEGHSY
ncbi:hypothetical protein F2Q68_00020919 [Brassica cretica]|uniref:Uncharacterized protein n=1 Tax=Brassica cretica TaxID=69181 RepID=A0A8S9FRB4_BRACR|nr:hypothetical protein F2Q68_00020919 [Brassica cretica]